MELDENCIFCNIIMGKAPSEKVYETEDVLVFKSINPVAKVHDLVVPKKHIEDIGKFSKEDLEYYMPKIFSAIQKVVDMEGIRESGYRVVANVGEDGGQSVPHTHFHILGGEKLPL